MKNLNSYTGNIFISLGLPKLIRLAVRFFISASTFVTNKKSKLIIFFNLAKIDEKLEDLILVESPMYGKPI